ncbi:MAG: DUF1697 domain-containing protein [Chitinophagales bacterium]
MQTYISILRGINVSGQKKMLMTDLARLYEDLGFKDVVTYIQSGNVIFKTDKKFTNVKLAKLIEDKIVATYNFQVPVIIRTLKELQDIISANPFVKEEIDSLYVTFLSNSPNEINLEKLDNVNFLPDKFEIIYKEIFLSVSSYGNTKLNNNFFENKLKVTATTRNWKTVNKLLELANE